jgi:hypothetical protein
VTTLDDAVAAGDRVTALAVAPESIAIAGEVLHERKRQTVRWGVQTLPDGTGHDRAIVYVNALQRMNDNAAGNGITWARVLLEEVAEVMNEKTGSPNLRTELLQVAAVAIQWVEAIDRREKEEAEPVEFGLTWGPGRGLTA